MQKKIEFQLRKKNSNVDTRDYEFPSNANFRLVYENIHKNLYQKLKDNEIITRYKKNLEAMLGENISIVEKLENPLARGQNLRAVKTQVKKDKEKSIKDFLNNKVSKNQLVEKFYHDYNVLKKKEMTADEFDEKMKRTQKIIKTKNRNRHFAETMLYLPKVIENIKNSGKIFLSKEDLKKLEKFLDKDERKYGNLIERNQKLNETEVKFKQANKELEQIRNTINFEQTNHENKKKAWKNEEQEQENKRKKWKLEATEHQKKRENWNNEKNKMQEEKESLEQEKTQAKNELMNLKTEIKEKIETLKNEKKSNSEIQKEALRTAVKELYEKNKAIYKENKKIKETAKNEATKELKENYKNDKEITKKAKNEAYEEYKANYALAPETIKKIEEKIIKTKYDEMLIDEDGKYSNLATKKALKNKEFAKKIVRKATEEKKSEIEKNPQKIKEIVAQIKEEYFFNSAKLKDLAILSELKKDWGLRGQVRESLKEDKYFRQEVMNEIKSDEKTEIAMNYIKNDMNSAEKTKFLKQYVNKDRIRNNVTKDELEKAEEEAKKEVIGEIKNENINLYQNILEIANYFYDFYKKFVEEELKQQFENTTYEDIYKMGIRTKEVSILDKTIKIFCRIASFFGIKNKYKRSEEKNEIKNDLEDLENRLELKENDRTQNKAF